MMNKLAFLEGYMSKSAGLAGIAKGVARRHGKKIIGAGSGAAALKGIHAGGAKLDKFIQSASENKKKRQAAAVGETSEASSANVKGADDNKG
jgi:hypothetical protein